MTTAFPSQRTLQGEGGGALPCIRPFSEMAYIPEEYQWDQALPSRNHRSCICVVRTCVGLREVGRLLVTFLLCICAEAQSGLALNLQKAPKGKIAVAEYETSR